MGLDSKHFAKSFDKCNFIFVDDPDEIGADSEFRQELNEVIAAKKVIKIEPTGLALCAPRRPQRHLRPRSVNGLDDASQSDHVQVPYSDHSSYTEIIEFVRRLRPKKVCNSS